MKSKLWNHCCGNIAVEASGKHLQASRGIWEASGDAYGGIWKHPGGSREARIQKASRGTQKAPRRHPGGTQEETSLKDREITKKAYSIV